jgi:hypothetical protein
MPTKSAFRVNPQAAQSQALGQYVLEQSTNARARVMASKRLPLFAYIYANKGLKSARAGPEIKAILQSLPPVKTIHAGAVVCAAVFDEVSVEEAKALQAKQDKFSKANVVVLKNATQILHLQRVFAFAPVLTSKRSREHRDSDKWFQLNVGELAECNRRLAESIRGSAKNTQGEIARAHNPFDDIRWCAHHVHIMFTSCTH